MEQAFKIIKNSLFIGISLIFIFIHSAQILYADTYYGYNQTIDQPLTSVKCNEFTFDATKSQIPNNPYISYDWDFGDGLTSREPVVTHTYQHSGDYTVHLTITDDSGYECSRATKSRTVRVNIPPRASFVSENESCTGAPIVFDASTSRTDTGRSLEYFWDFGDGDIRRGPAVITKTFVEGGNYIVRLKVDDHSGTPCSSQRAEKTIRINEPPRADAGDDVILKCVENADGAVVHFDASASSDRDNDRLSYSWDFGDGYNAQGSKVSHRYTNVGNYDVKLTVSDGTSFGCDKSFDHVKVRINQAPMADAGNDMTTCVGHEVIFDGSQSDVYKKGTAVAQWSFGDGATARGLYATHRYSQPGIYQVTLALENKLNPSCPVSRDTKTVVVNSAPKVHIRSPITGCAQKEIFFDASSADDADGDALRYFWNFGDGTTQESGPNVSHRYANGGNYRISVTVDDHKGTACSTTTASVSIAINTPPVADAGPNLSCCVNKEASFDAGASSDPDGNRLSYYWDFGDGVKKSGRRAIHAFSHAGSYNVRLTVDDNSSSECSRSTDGFTAVVKDVPAPYIHIY